MAVARGDLVVCGGAVFARVFERVDPSVRIALREPDGTRVEKGRALWIVEGPRARSPRRRAHGAQLHAANERGRHAGARATSTRSPGGSTTVIADTRKTTPGLRALERYAVRTGGAHNHRNDLLSAVLIKDNHIIAAGGIERAIERARKRAPHTSRIEVEVQTLEELERALAARADIILLDNFALEALREAVRRTDGRAPSSRPRAA